MERMRKIQIMKERGREGEERRERESENWKAEKRKKEGKRWGEKY